MNEQYINQLVEEGYIYKKFSEDGRLYLLNYSPKCTFEKKWNKYTINARGHVFEVGTNKPIAIAFPKFFNLTELAVSRQRNLLKRTEYRIITKEDGSLGIVYNYDGIWRINTRGSFGSDQAKEGLKILNEKYDLSEIDPDITILTEIIYPENRIIINYADRRELILLSAYNRTTGKELHYRKIREIGEKTGMWFVRFLPKVVTLKHIIEYLDDYDKVDKEGFVIRFKKDGLRIKIKSKEYLRVARIIANMTPLSLWKSMEMGKVKIGVLENLPEEFREELDEMVVEIEKEYADLKSEIEAEYNEIMKSNPTNKEIGLRTDLTYKSGIFMIRNNKPAKLDFMIMKRIRPKGEA